MGRAIPGSNLINDDPKVYAALIDSFSKGFTDKEACFAAGISNGTLYAYCDMFPEFTDHKENLKQTPILNAKSRVTSVLHEDTNTAKWLLERLTKEFKPPDRQGNNTLNTLIIGTNLQLQEKLAHKLTKWLTRGDQGSDDNVTDADYAEDMSKTGQDS